MRHRILFGPIRSRRLGISLGVDIIPLKTCTFNCVYCECGETTNLTLKRREYVSLKEVTGKLEYYLKKNPHLDHITFSGSGEPTLHSRIHKIIGYIRDNFPRYQVAVLTNGSLLNQEEVRKALKEAQVVIPSLNAVTPEVFEKINRHHPEISSKQVISGLIKFRQEYRGKMLLEIFIVPGLNDGQRELELLKEAIERIKPDQVQLGTLYRWGTEDWVEEAEPANMERIAAYLKAQVT